MSQKTDIVLNVNGRDHKVSVEARKTLVDAIREDCGQTGTHIGCEHGICGACTVIVDGEPVRSCLMFAVQADGKRVRTVEGLANGDKLHPMQSAFMEHHALQCGFCTPGFLMLAVGVLERELATLNPLLRGFAGALFGGVPDASLERSAALLQRAARLGPGFVAPHLELARTYVEMDREADARAQLEQALTLQAREQLDRVLQARARELLRDLS